MSGKRLLLAVLLVILLGVTGLMAPVGLPRASAQLIVMLIVDDDGVECPFAGFTTISDALAAANPGWTIFVCPGTYDEQVTVTKNGITIEGSGIGSTVVKPTSLPESSTSLFSGAELKYIILVDGVSDVTIKGLTVDGSDAANTFSGCSPGYIGIFYRGASGSIEEVEVKNVKLPPDLLGCQDQLGIFVQSGQGKNSDVEVRNSYVHDYGKNGITCNEPGTTCTILDNTVIGLGPGVPIAQNGIQVAFGATFKDIKGNTVRDNIYTQSGSKGWIATGILIFQADISTWIQGQNGIGKLQSYLETNNAVKRNQCNVCIVP